MYIVADIGGTRMRIAKSDDLEKLGEPLIVDTPKDYAEGIAGIIGICRQMAGNEKIDAMAFDVTGIVSEDAKVPLTSPHLPDWKGKPLGRELEAALSTSVHLLN